MFLTNRRSHKQVFYCKSLFLSLQLFFCEDLSNSCFVFVFHLSSVQFWKWSWDCLFTWTWSCCWNPTLEPLHTPKHVCHHGFSSRDLPQLLAHPLGHTSGRTKPETPLSSQSKAAAGLRVKASGPSVPTAEDHETEGGGRCLYPAKGWHISNQWHRTSPVWCYAGVAELWGRIGSAFAELEMSLAQVLSLRDYWQESPLSHPTHQLRYHRHLRQCLHHRTVCHAEIIEQPRGGVTSKDHLVQHFLGKGAYMRLSSSRSNRILNTSSAGDVNKLLGKMPKTTPAQAQETFIRRALLWRWY